MVYKLKEKSYKANGGDTFSFKILYYDRDKDDSTCDVVSFFKDTEGKFNGRIFTLNDYSIYLIGDDGEAGRGFGTTHAIQSKYRCIAREDVISDLMEFAKTSFNHAIKVNDVTMCWYTDGSQFYTSPVKDRQAIYQTPQHNVNYGTQVYDAPEVNTKFGKYLVKFYSTDSNPKDYENVVIERNDGIRCRVHGLKNMHIKFNTIDGTDDSINVKMILLSSVNHKGELCYFTIYDDVMYDSLMTLEPDTVNNSDIWFKNDTFECTLNDSGIIIDIPND